MLSATDTPTTNLAEFNVPFLKPLAQNKFTQVIIWYFYWHFENVLSLFIAILEVDAIFTNYALEEANNNFWVNS